MRSVAAVALGCLGALGASAPSADARVADDPVVADLQTWSPVGEGEWVGDAFVSLAGTPECESGGQRNFTRPDSTNVVLAWYVCGSAEVAAEFASTVASNNNLVALPGAPPSLKDGEEFVGLIPGVNGVRHLWAQGRYYLDVSLDAWSSSAAPAVGRPSTKQSPSRRSSDCPFRRSRPTSSLRRAPWTRGCRSAASGRGPRQPAWSNPGAPARASR